MPHTRTAATPPPPARVNAPARGPVVRELMTPRDALVTADPEFTLRELAELFAARRVTGAPVLAGSTLVGVVSATDLLEFAASTGAAPALDEGEWNAEPGPEDGGAATAAYFQELWTAGLTEEIAARFTLPAAYERDAWDEHTVDDVMSRGVIGIPPGATVREAADAMHRCGVHRLLVMDGDRLDGVITATDVLRAVADGRLAAPAG
ncbi:MAG TPA: CBS domain-containing protein [Longimicrobium sp.]|nr:CBS domain-containing protein [Longimicrobium sp.]